MLRICLLGIVLTGLAGAQTVTDVTLPAGMPPLYGTFGIAGIPMFTTNTSLAFTTADRIHVWTSLPTAPTYSPLLLVGAQQMFGPAFRLWDDTAIYRSLGADMTSLTSDDELILIRGLPDAPQLVPTGLFGGTTPHWGWIPVNEGCAMRSDGTGFTLLRHDANGISLQNVAVPGGLVTTFSFRSGPLDADTVAAMAPGPDGFDGTPDDELVLVRGLDGAGPPMLESHPIPFAGNPRAFEVTDDGMCVVAREIALPSIELYVLQPGAPGAPPAVHAITVNTGAGSFSTGPYYYYSLSLEPVPGGGVTVSNDDDIGFGYVMLGDLAGTPTIKHSWMNCYGSNTNTRALYRDETFAHTDSGFATPFEQFTYSRNASMGTQTVIVSQNTNANLPLIKYTPVRLGNGALAIVWSEAGTISPCRITMLRDPFAANAVTTTVPTTGYWVRSIVLGPAHVAAFLATTPAVLPSPNILRIVSAPRATTEEFTHPGGFAPIQLSYTPTLPSITAPFQVDVLVSPSLSVTSVHLLFTLERLPDAVAIPGVTGLVAIDPTTLIGDFTVPLAAPGVGQLAAPANSVPPSLTDIPFWLQAYAVDAGGVHLSDLGLIVLGT